MHIIEGNVPLRHPAQYADVAAQNTWHISNGTISSTAAGPCLALAAHNARTLTGLGGHFAEPSCELPPPNSPADYNLGHVRFNEALEALPAIGPPNHTSLWVGGIALYDVFGPYDKSEHQHALAERAYTLRRIGALRLSFAALHVDWTELPYGLVYFMLDCPSSVVTINREILHT